MGAESFPAADCHHRSRDSGSDFNLIRPISAQQAVARSGSLDCKYAAHPCGFRCLHLRNERRSFVIYFDTAYIAKCYLNEPGAPEVRALARQTGETASCELVRAELACTLLRHIREGYLAGGRATEVSRLFNQDIQSGVWILFPLSTDLILQTAQRITQLFSTGKVFLRASDAIHLACAQHQGFTEIYSNDRRLLDCAPLFNLTGRNIL